MHYCTCAKRGVRECLAMRSVTAGGTPMVSSSCCFHACAPWPVADPLGSACKMISRSLAELLAVLSL